MKRQAAVIILALMTLSCMVARYRPGSSPIHQGAGDFIFTDTQGNSDKPIKIWYYQPAGFSPDMPVLFVMHGVKRDAQRYRDEWIQYADLYGFLLIAPEFSHKYYPGKSEYNEGNLFDKMENPIPENNRAFTLIEHLFDFIKAATQNRNSSYNIYGHSAGGQFVQRMVLFKTDARIRMAIAANPGVYAIANFSEKYPYGIRNSGVTPEDLRKAFETNFILLLGEMDVNEDDANLSRSPDALAQGNNRFERGNNFYASAKNEASRLGMVFSWKLTTVPGASHHNAQLAQTAARFLFLKGND
jgi:dienelactone hydrolase